MKPSEALHNHKTAVLAIAASISTQNVRVFGSAFNGEDTEKSDLDWLVDVPPGTTLLDMVGLQTALEDELGISVDIRTQDER